MPNIGIVSQARLGSSRLPAKVLMTAGGRTLLEWHFDRLQKAGYQAILATTDRTDDDPLYEWAREVGVDSFRGSEDNVLSRYRECARQFKLDVIVRVTSDCPLIDGELIAAGIDHYLAFDETRQYVTNGQRRTFPRGFDFEIFSRELLEEAYQNAVEPYEFEHVTPYFYSSARNSSARNTQIDNVYRTSPAGNLSGSHKHSSHNRFQNSSQNSPQNSPVNGASRNKRASRRMDIALRHFEQAVDYSHLRVTVDTLADYDLVLRLIEDYNAGQKNHQQITAILHSNPQLVAINHDVEQKQVG